MAIAIIGSVVSGCSVEHQPEPKQTISMELLSEDWEAYSETFAKVRYGDYNLCELPYKGRWYGSNGGVRFPPHQLSINN